MVLCVEIGSGFFIEVVAVDCLKAGGLENIPKKIWMDLDNYFVSTPGLIVVQVMH